MRKHVILLSAVLLVSPFLFGCTDKSAGSSVPDESAADARPLIEIDPFEGIGFVYYHTESGEVTEKSGSGTFYEPMELTVGDVKKTIQLMRDAKADGIIKCRNLGCHLKIYRETLPQDLAEGDTVTLCLLPDPKDITDIAAYAEETCGIRLTRTTMEIPVHFEEEPVQEINPFETVDFSFYRMDDHYEAQIIEKQSAKEQYDLLKQLKIDFSPSLEEGLSVDDLFVGDKVRFTVFMEDCGSKYRGEDVNRKLEKEWKRVHLTKTEQVVDVMPANAYHRYSKNVNVMLNRPDDWYQIVQNRNRLTKYDLRHIDGSTATIPITAELVRQFCGVDDNLLEAYVDHNTTGPAYENLIFGRAGKNIIFVTEPSAEELGMAAQNNVELDVTQIALDGFVFITHKDNPVDSLTVEQIQDIYTGNITNWQEVGGLDEEIVAYQREPNSGSQTVMENMVMNGLEMMEPLRAPVVMTMGDLVDNVAEYRNATHSIGYSFYYYINNLYQNADIKVIKIDGISPENENLLDGSYQFSSGYYAVTIRGADPKADEIRDYLLSDEGQEIVRLAGYCPIR